MIGEINKLFLYIINLPIYCLSLFVPRKSNIWIFGAWFGEKYSDNSKYLFEYVNQHHKNIQCIWLSRNRDTVSQLKMSGYASYYTYSLRAYWLSLRAKVGVITTGFRDINPFQLKNMTIVQLWHGTPLKKIMHDDKITFREPNKIIQIVFPFIRHETNHTNQMFIAASEEVQKKISSAFRVDAEQVAITGYPRTDTFFCKERKEYPGADECDVPKFLHHLQCFRSRFRSEREQVFRKQRFSRWLVRGTQGLLRLPRCGTEQRQLQPVLFWSDEICEGYEISLCRTGLPNDLCGIRLLPKPDGHWTEFRRRRRDNRPRNRP